MLCPSINESMFHVMKLLAFCKEDTSQIYRTLLPVLITETLAIPYPCMTV